jgi:hypothetical protein
MINSDEPERKMERAQEETPHDIIKKHLTSLKKTYATCKTHPRSYRVKQLKSLAKGVAELGQ